MNSWANGDIPFCDGHQLKLLLSVTILHTSVCVDITDVLWLTFHILSFVVQMKRKKKKKFKITSNERRIFFLLISGLM
ncbi:hypothetical protein RIR_jg40727.t1 [Rhizophagus irregularis DAOM 181602=DAOM 197198]|nr:hypothetical protein RIR_jg40727.t1 [Rhizophagus irregularis DAOM 181602=DAOM 197198]